MGFGLAGTMEIDEEEPIKTNRLGLSGSFDKLGLSGGFDIPNPEDELSFSEKILTSKPSELITQSEEFFKNIQKSFKRGIISADIDQASYLAMQGKLDFEKEVQPLIAEQKKILEADPINGKNIISNAIYSVAQMIPAMGKGIIEGAGTGGTAGLITAGTGMGALALPMAAAGQVAGSMSYWYRQGAGQLYAEQRAKEIPDNISIPISNIAGAIYAGIEFSQVDKLIPGTKQAAKRLISDSVGKTISKLALRYGTNWAQEVGEEGLQEIVMSVANDTSSKIAGKEDKQVQKIFTDAMVSGWNASKDSALPMILLLGPSAGVDISNISDEEKIKSEVRKESVRKVIREAKIEEERVAKGVNVKGEPLAEGVLPEKVDVEGKVVPVKVEQPSKEVKDMAVEAVVTPEEDVVLKKTAEEEATEKPSEARTQVEKEVVETSEGLIEEAKKYKTVEEWIDVKSGELSLKQSELQRLDKKKTLPVVKYSKREKLRQEVGRLSVQMQQIISIWEKAQEKVSVVEEISDLLAASEGPQIIKTEEGYKRLGSGWPTFLSNKGYNRKQLDTIFRKYTAGESLTDKQQGIIDTVVQDYEALKNNVAIEDKMINNELDSLRDRFPEITNQDIQEINVELDQEEVWDEERYERAVEKYTTKKARIDEGQREVPTKAPPEITTSKEITEQEEKIRGLSKSVEKKAIEEGLTEALGDLPTYQKRDMADVAERASDFINTDYELAKKIALRESPEQGNLRAEELFTAISIKAVAEEDIDTIRELATSEKAAKAGTEAGQRIKALDSSNENDPVKVIKTVTKEREEYSKGISKEKKDAQITKLQNKLRELEEKVKTIESDLAENKTKRKARDKKPFGSKNKVFTQEGLEDARAALKGKLFGLHSGIDPTAVVDLTKIGGFYFEGGIRNFSEWSKTMSQEFGDKVLPYLRKVWGNIQKQYNESKIKGIKEKLSDGRELENANYLVQQLAESLIASGTVKRGALVHEVKSILEEYYPDITARETADLISGYGQYKLLNKDKVKQILRDLKGQLQQISKLEDLKKNQIPSKTGIERRVPSAEEKRLIKLVNEAKVKYGIKARQETSLKALKTRLENETKRLESKLEEMDFDEIQKREIILDAKAIQLKEQRDRVKNAYNAAKYLKEGLTKEEMTKIVILSKKASDAKTKLLKSNDWTADNAQQVENYFYSKKEFEDYVESLMPVSQKDVVNNFVDYFRASILASPRILRNSFLYQVIPGIERTITKRLVTGVFNDADINSGIIEKLHAKLSGLKLNKKDADFIKRQVVMATRIYHKTGYDISRMDKMGVPPKYFGEHVGKIRGDSPFAKYAKIVNLAPKWMAGGTDMLFANIGRADTAILMSKERAHIENVKGILPEGVSEQERANQLLKDSYSFSPSENASNQIREAGIRDAHMMNNTQPGWWSDKVIEFRRMLNIGGINFGKALIPFAKIANVVVAEGVKTASGYGIAKSLYDINQSAKETDLNKRANSLSASVNNLVRYAGLTGAALVFTAFLDDDDFVGEWDVISKKAYILARAKGAGANYVKIGGKWISLRYLPMINIPISAIMMTRQAKARGDSVATGYLSGIVGAVMSAPGIKESKDLFKKIGWSLKADNMEKVAKSMKLDWSSMSDWAKVRMIPSVLSYDVWNALFPKDSKYDFMGREIQKAKVFKDDVTNDIILEYERLAKTGNFPVISDPGGKYAKELEEKLGEEEYQKVLNKFKQNYSDSVGKLINTQYYKSLNNEKKKKKIDKKRKLKIMNPINKLIKE